MQIHVTCPGCSKDYTLPQTVAGKKVRCKACGEAFVAQGTAAPAADDGFDLKLAGDEDDGDRGTRKSGASAPRSAAGAAGADGRRGGAAPSVDDVLSSESRSAGAGDPVAAMMAGLDAPAAPTADAPFPPAGGQMPPMQGGQGRSSGGFPILPVALGGGALLVLCLIVGVVAIVLTAPSGTTPSGSVASSGSPSPSNSAAHGGSPIASPSRPARPSAAPRVGTAPERATPAPPSAPVRRQDGTVGHAASSGLFKPGERPAAPANRPTRTTTSRFPGGAIGDWRVEPDPTPKNLQYTLRTGMKYEPRQPRTDLRTPFYAKVFVNKVSVVDARGQRTIGRPLEMGRGVFVDSAAVNTNGRLLAIAAYQGDRRFVVVTRPGQTSDAYVIDLPAGQQAELPPVWLNERVLVVSDEGRAGAHYTAYDALDRKELWTQRARSRELGEAIAPSPGGKYLAVGASDQGLAIPVSIFDGETGEEVGRLRTGDKEFKPSAIAFSPDGTKLVVREHGEARFAAFDLADGRQLSLVQARTTKRLSDDSPLDWIADSSCFVCGPLVIESSSGGVVADLSEHSSSFGTERWLVAPGSVLKKTSIREAEVREIDRKWLEDAIELARSGGDPEEVGLPVAVTAPRLTAMELPAPGVLSRVAEPDPVKVDASSWFSRPVTVGGPPKRVGRSVQIPVSPGERGSKSKVLIASAAPRVLVREYFKGDGSYRHMLARLDASGRVEVRLPGQFQALAVSPDGERGVFAATKRRVDVYQLTPAEHVVGWRIPHLPGKEDRAVEVRQAWVAGPERVLTQTADGRLTLWRVTADGVEGIFELSEPSLVTAGLTPGGRYVACATSDGAYLLSVETGEVVAGLPLEGQPFDMACSSDGRRIAILASDTARTDLIVWDLAEGPQPEVLLPRGWSRGEGRVVWAGPDHLLVGGQYLVNASTGAAEWAYKGLAPVPHPFSDAVCHVAMPGGQPIRLEMLALPHNTAEAALAAAGDRPAPAPLVGPGQSVRMKVGGVSNRRDVEARLRQRLERAGMTIAGDGACTLQMSSKRDSKKQVYEHMGSRKRETVTITTTTTTLEWLGPDRKRLWSTSMSYSNDPGSFISLRDGQSLSQVMRQKDRTPVGWTFPTLIARNASEQVLGSSEMAADGMVDGGGESDGR